MTIRNQVPQAWTLTIQVMTPVDTDLHLHTPHVPADYRGPADTGPRDLVEAAAASGLGMIAVTDHFSVGYVENVMQAARRHAEMSGTEVVVLPGVELRVEWGSDEAHLVALLPPESYQECFANLARKFGLDEHALDTVELPSLKIRAHPCAVAKCVTALGGISHLAHADRYFGTYRLLDSPLFDELASHPDIGAVDVVDATQAADIKRRAPGVSVISSSDAHSPDEIGRRRATLWLEEPSFGALARALGGRSARAASGLGSGAASEKRREHAEGVSHDRS